ncbi:MAG TPA: transporter substrate-binding domain-containing protein, partial [Candidatus Limnocylindrales bacterium]
RPQVRGLVQAPMGSLVAFALVTVLVAGLLVIGPEVGRRLTEPPPTDVIPTTDLLDRVRTAGSIRVAVRADHPQLREPSGGLTGFDVDVAEALGTALGVQAEIVIVDATEFTSGSGGPWDIGLPSGPAPALDDPTIASSEPYYYWPRYLLVHERSDARTVADLAGQRVCAVGGDAGEAWLVSGAGAGVTTEVVAKTSDDACLEAIDSGEVDAMVTSTLSEADLGIRPSLTVIGGPAVEPRVVIAPRATDPTRLIDEIDRVLVRLRSDGTLSGLSERRFGGHDLSSPPPR